MGRGRGLGWGTYNICIPHSNDVSDSKFPHEQTIHPPETELDELYALLVEMVCERGVNAGYQFAEGGDHSLDSGLGEDVIVLEKEVSIRKNSIRGREVFSAGVFGGKGTAAKTGIKKRRRMRDAGGRDWDGVPGFHRAGRKDTKRNPLLMTLVLRKVMFLDQKFLGRSLLSI